jgi:hypothetical protein
MFSWSWELPRVLFEQRGRRGQLAKQFRCEPLHTLLHAFTLLALAALWRGWRGVVATVLIVALCAIMTIAAAGEPAGLPANNVPRWAWIILGTIGGYAPLVVAALGLADLVRRYLSRYNGNVATSI